MHGCFANLSQQYQIRNQRSTFFKNAKLVQAIIGVTQLDESKQSFYQFLTPERYPVREIKQESLGQRWRDLEKFQDPQWRGHWWAALRTGHPTLPKATRGFGRAALLLRTARWHRGDWSPLVQALPRGPWVLAWLMTPADREESMASKNLWARVENTNDFIL